MNPEDRNFASEWNELSSDSRDLNERIVSYVDEECDDSERQRLEEEARHDPTLSREIEIQRLLGDALASVYRARLARDEGGADLARRVRQLARRRRRRWIAVCASAAALLVSASLLTGVFLSGGADPSAAQMSSQGPQAPELTQTDSEIVETLDVLETLLDQDVELTPELTVFLLEEEVDQEELSFSDDAEALFDYLLEEEFAIDF